jgi:hypothetical protein
MTCLNTHTAKWVRSWQKNAFNFLTQDITLHHDKLWGSVKIFHTDQYLNYPTVNEILTKYVWTMSSKCVKQCENIHSCTHFKSGVLVAVTMKITVFLDFMPCSVVDMYQYFKEIFFLHQQGRSTHDTCRFPRNVGATTLTTTTLISTYL